MSAAPPASSETSPLLGAPAPAKKSKTVTVHLDAGAMRFVRALAYILSLAQIGVAIAAIVLTLEQPCDRPLKLFVILYGVRIFLAVPFHGKAHFGVWSTAEPTRTTYNVLLLLVDIFALVLFVFANFWIYTVKTCQDSAPWAYWVSVAFVIWEWVTIAIPLTLASCTALAYPFGPGIILALIVMMSVLRPGSHMSFVGRPVVAKDHLGTPRPAAQAPVKKPESPSSVGAPIAGPASAV